MKQQRFHYLARILKIGVLFCGFYVIISLLNYMYTDISAIQYYRILWNEYYENQGCIDNVFLGSSHVYEDINTEIMNELSGQRNFNMASPAQPLNGSYYLLKQAINDNNLSHVYLELYYICSVKDNFNEDLDAIIVHKSNNWSNIDFMKISRNKLAYMIASSNDIEDLPDIFFPFIRYREKLGRWGYVKTNLATKATENYRSYRYYREFDDYYMESHKGMYIYVTKTFVDNDRLYEQDRILDENPVGEASEAYLRKIIEYCQQRDIPITLFVSPMDNLRLISTLNYDNYINQVRKIASEYNVAFYDFNLIKQPYLNLDKRTCFSDNNHLNAEGAALYTPILYEVLTGNIDQNSSLFYASYKEKLINSDPDFYGLYYRDHSMSQSTEEVRTYHIASNRNDMEYRIIITTDKDEQYQLQDFNTNTSFTLPISEHGVCTIVSRMKEEPKEIIQTMEINF